MHNDSLGLAPPAISAPKFFGQHLGPAHPLDALATLAEDQLHLLHASTLRRAEKALLGARLGRLCAQLALALRLHRGRPPSLSQGLADLVRRAGEIISADTVAAAAAAIAGGNDHDDEVALAPAALPHRVPLRKAGDRQRLFARLVAAGTDPAEAYGRAGYAAGPAASGNAKKLLATPAVRVLIEQARGAECRH